MSRFPLWLLVVFAPPITKALDEMNDTFICSRAELIMNITNCESDVGPPFNCSDQILQHLRVVFNLTEEGILNPRDISFDSPTRVYEAFTRLISAKEMLYTFLTEMHGQSKNSFSEQCFDIKSLKANMEHDKAMYKNFRYHQLWMDYYFPAISGVEFIFGMLSNIMIIVIFVRHRDMRTEPNKIIVNLAVCDILLLINNVPIYYIRYRWMPLRYINLTVCHLIAYTKMVVIAGSIYSMVVLSMLRFLATAAASGSRAEAFMEKYIKISVMLIGIWVVAALIAIPDASEMTAFCELKIGRSVVYYRFVALCMLPLAAIGGFSLATSRILGKSLRRLPGQAVPSVLHEKRVRQRGARLILCLVVVFCFTYLPLNVYLVLALNYELYKFFAVRLMVPLNSCLNPVALYVGSEKFRMYFKQYFCRCCSKNSVENGSRKYGTSC